MVAWLSDGQCQEETKQGPKISLLRDNGSYAHYSHQCCGSPHLPPPPHWIWWFRVRLGQLRINSGVWDVGLTYIPIGDTAVF